MADGAIDGTVDIEAHQQHQNQHGPYEKAALGIAPESQRTTAHHLVVQGKVDAGQDHEDDDDRVDVNTVVVGNRSVAGGESAGGHGGKGVAECIIQAHAAQQQQHDLRQRHESVDLPEDHGRVADARFEFVRHRGGNLGLVKLHAADAQKRQDRDREHDDAHAAQPLDEAAPEQQPLGNQFDVRQNRGTGGGRPADRFEKGIHETAIFDPKVERQRAGQPDGRPGNGHNGHALPLGDHLRLGPSEKQMEQCAATDRENHRFQQRNDACIFVEQAAEQWEDHRQAEKEIQDTDDVEDVAPAHLEELQLDRHNLLDTGDRLPGGKYDDPVAGFDNALSGGDDDFLLANDAGHNGPFWKGHALEGFGDDVGGFHGHGFHDLGLLALDRYGRNDFAAPDVLQDRVDGRQPRTDHLLDADGGHQGEIAELADLGDGLTGTHAARQKGGQDIGLLVVGQRDHHVDVLDVLLGQQALVGPVAAEHHHFVEFLGQQAAAFGVSFDDLALNRALIQQGGQSETDAAAADDEHPVERLGVFVEHLKGSVELVFLADKVDQVAGHQPVSAARNDEFVLAHHGCDQRSFVAEHRRQVGELDSCQAGRLFKVDADELDAPVGELAHVHRTGHLHQAVDGLDHLDLGIDNGVDVGSVLLEVLVIVVIVRVANAGQLFRGGREHVGHQAGHQVGLIPVCHRQKDIGRLDAGFREHHRAAAGSEDHLDIDVFRYPSQGIGVLVDHHHVLVFMGEMTGNVKSDLTGPDDDNFQT